MTTDSALPELRGRLADAGSDASSPDLAVLWRVLREWVAVPVRDMDPECDADMLLFGGYLDLKPADRWHPGPSFALHFTRQFRSEDKHGEYLGMAQLTAAVIYDVNDDFRAITTMASWSEQFGTADQSWGNGAHRAAEWVARVERSHSYQTALRHRPTDMSLTYGPV